MTAAVKTNDQMDKSFLKADVRELVKKMTIGEKVGLLAGKDWWSTQPVPRLNIPSVKVTDGPNGARGDSFFKMTPATALPNATCIGATFSHQLTEEGGRLLAAETKARNAVCLLAPTINIQRSPLGGRAFESFSEDPTLSGQLAAAYVNGLQGAGVSATIKHFVGNDQEHERMGEDSIIDERTLREVYLRPFQIAQKHAKPWAYMTSYNKVNGTHASENRELLTNILRKEWQHDGLIMSDWYGTYSVSEAIDAGLNLEMPGPPRWRNQDLVSHLINAHKVDVRQVDKLAIEVLTWVQKLAKINEALVYAKPSAEKTRTSDKAKDAKVVRKIGAEGIVVLKNEEGILPVKDTKVAVIGPNAKDKVLTGGGSAQLRSSWAVTPYQGLVDNKPSGVTIDYALGASTAKFLPMLDEHFTTLDGKPGFNLYHYPFDGDKMASEPAVTDVHDVSNCMMADLLEPALGSTWFTELKAEFTSPIDGEYEFGLTVTGQGWLWLDDKLIVDNSKDQIRGEAFFGNGTEELLGKAKVEKGKKYILRVLHDPRKPKKSDDIPDEITPFKINSLRVGAFQAFDADEEIARAATLAASSDTAILIVGLNADWESEGFDRPNLSLPLRTDELISRVAEAQPNTIVVIQAGSAVSMPWADKVKGIVYAWYGGNETGNSIADIIYGIVNPSGRLPLSFPKSQLDIAANLNYKSAQTRIHYQEGIWVGYKHHNARGIPPLYPFGHGLSYTTFEYSNLKITSAPSPKKSGSGFSSSSTSLADEWKIKVMVDVTNTGKVTGSHSVHFYTCPPEETATSLRHPEHALQAFGKVYDLKPGKKETVEVTLDKYAISHWDDKWKTFRVEQGEWTIKVGIDAQTMYGRAAFIVDDVLEWTGI